MKLLLHATDLEKGFGDQVLFQIPRLELFEGQRIGLAGVNGCGKTTLLHLLAGTLPPDAGNVTRCCQIALLRQPGLGDTHPDALCRSATDGRKFLPSGPGKSGGEQTRLAIAAAFSQNAPLLFADEPTNNLDIDGISLLQDALLHYTGALVLVSHDRALLDAVCTTIWALEDGSLRQFTGNYSDWIAQREREREFAAFEFEQYREEKARLTQEMLTIRQNAKNIGKPPRRMNSSEWLLYKGIASVQQAHVQNRAKTMRKRIDHLEVKEKPRELPQVRMQGQSAQPVSKSAVRVTNADLYHGSYLVQKGISLTLPTGSKSVLLGPNGCGKTTLANHILTYGDGVSIAPGLRIGTFSQTHAMLDPDSTVLENARADSTLPESEVRTVLANLLFPAAQISKPVHVLSGGERAKVAFARLLCAPYGCLILDEPTNHIDSFAAEALETLLSRWEGTLLLITHDRRLAQRVGQRLLFMEKHGGIKSFEGTWQEWEQSRIPKKPDALQELMEQMRRCQEASQIAPK